MHIRVASQVTPRPLHFISTRQSNCVECWHEGTKRLDFLQTSALQPVGVNLQRCGHLVGREVLKAGFDPRCNTKKTLHL